MKRFIFPCLLLFVCYQSCKSPSENPDHQQEHTSEMEAVPSIVNGEEVKLLLDARAKLGEGAIWHYETNMLYWVDIEGKTLHLYNPATGEDRSLPTLHRIGTVVPSQEANKAVVALQEGIFSMDTESGQLNIITNPLEGQSDIRLNDGKCDPAGRLWVGSMHLKAQQGAASLYRIDLDGTVERMLENITISNGIVWSLDQKTMYYIDTPTKQVQAFDYDQTTGNISNARIVVQVGEEDGSPDGMAIDAEGKLWIAHWGGHAVIRWDPDTGEQLQKIDVPAPNVTSCAFGGENLEVLFITTASIGMSEEKKQEFPHAGGLFAIRPGVKGVKADFYRGKL